MKKSIFPVFGRFSQIEVVFAVALIAMTASMLMTFNGAYQRQAEEVAAREKGRLAGSHCCGKDVRHHEGDDQKAIDHLLLHMPVR